MRWTPALLRWGPARQRHMKRQQCLHRPAMASDPRRHGRRGPLAGVETLVRRTKVIDCAHHEHPLVQGLGLACQRPAPARQRREAFPERRVQSVTVDRRIAPPTAATERRVWLSPHAAPQYSDACHADLAGDSLLAPAFSHRGNVHAALVGSQSAHHGGDHEYGPPQSGRHVGRTAHSDDSGRVAV